MSKFYGTLQGNRGQATRCGTNASGMEAVAASWAGAVRSSLIERNGEIVAVVELIPWHGAGVRKVLYEGPVGGGEITATEDE